MASRSRLCTVFSVCRNTLFPPLPTLSHPLSLSHTHTILSHKSHTYAHTCMPGNEYILCTFHSALRSVVVFVMTLDRSHCSQLVTTAKTKLFSTDTEYKLAISSDFYAGSSQKWYRRWAWWKKQRIWAEICDQWWREHFLTFWIMICL